MPKMSKHQAWKRLSEARIKIGRVWLNRGGGALTASQAGKLSAMVKELDNLLKAIK